MYAMLKLEETWEVVYVNSVCMHILMYVYRQYSTRKILEVLQTNIYHAIQAVFAPVRKCTAHLCPTIHLPQQCAQAA